ncbi:MAG: ribosome-associated translation inhibitor RaiA [Clostridia bacterium]|nr:ribosome-associated translation inhibitor RaiA [Clostridia bacterium]
MRTEIMAKSYRLDENLKNLIIKKLSKFDKYFNNEAIAKIKLSTVGAQQRMEISIDADNMSVRSSADGEKMNENIDVILPKLERQIRKNKDKFGEKLKKGSVDTPALFEQEPEEAKGNVVKVKKFDISVTTVDNAVEEMELLNHNFYIFVNGENNKVSVLYKRNDGDYGLIEPEY